MKIDIDFIRNSKDLSKLNSCLENIIYSNITEDDIQAVAETLRSNYITCGPKVAEFERDMILERQREGIALAKERGAYKGRAKIKIDDFGKYYEKYKSILMFSFDEEAFESLKDDDEYMKKIKKDVEDLNNDNNFYQWMTDEEDRKMMENSVKKERIEEGIEKTVRWYLDNQEWLDNVTSGDYQKYYETMYTNR